MFKIFKHQSLYVFAAFVAGFLIASGERAHATTYGSGSGGGKNFSDIASNITTSIADLPGLITGVAYLLGVLLGVMGILKVKDHVENPSQTPLKDGAVRLASGGALFALPIVTEAMSNTIGTTGYAVSVPQMHRVEMGVR